MSKLYNLKKAAWYSVENITTIAFGLVSVVMVARFFGPENLGKLSMVQTISSVTLFLVVLGLDHIVVRDLTNEKNNITYMYTILIIQCVGFLIHIFVVYAMLFYIYDWVVEDDIIIIAIWILLSVYFSRATILKLYFQSNNKPEVIASSALASRGISIIYMMMSIYYEFNYHFVIAFIPLQAFLQFLFLLTVFLKNNFFDLKGVKLFNIEIAKKVLGEALPLIGASILFPLFIQADILLISVMLTEKDVGIYSAASRLISQFVFIGNIITMTFYLALSNRVNQSSSDEKEFIKGMFSILFSVSFFLSVIIYFFSDLIISSLYGESFHGAEQMLEILVWKWIFIFPAALYSRLLILYGLSKYELFKSFFVAILSLSLNFILIPKYGVVSAAYISLFSYFIADFLIYLFFKKTRFIFYMEFSSIFIFFTSPRENIKRINYIISRR
ncbi:oligosaccharide flippase family protein [Vibrio cholerae]|uniref:oligosaccharide flippase family protein n=1 Tax=Vibrio cholerae TaxID=666 RepID=UPI0011DA1B01|nr:oligosaccharide flippase family protein [Vibrio cholerae]MDX5048747.1 oligosaccharide flippase family protein [Vibrio cholerae]TXZ88666.1 oligosaccharide flippase family protein [Vibrio cholerae]GHY15917.1 flippase [Vibrio cholerae]